MLLKAKTKCLPRCSSRLSHPQDTWECCLSTLCGYEETVARLGSKSENKILGTEMTDRVRHESSQPTQTFRSVCGNSNVWTGALSYRLQGHRTHQTWPGSPPLGYVWALFRWTIACLLTCLGIVSVSWLSFRLNLRYRQDPVYPSFSRCRYHYDQPVY